MKVLKSWPVDKNYTIASVSEIPREIIAEHAKKFLMSEYPMLPKSLGADGLAIEKLKQLKENLRSQFSLKLILLKGSYIIGWTDGWQDSVEQDSFFMGSSLVLPEYRRKGLYTALVKKVIDLTKENGFQSVWSLHLMTNNPVLIGKLKLGFHIFGFEMNTRYGVLVRLIYHHNAMKEKALRFRAGAVGEDEIYKVLSSADR